MLSAYAVSACSSFAAESVIVSWISFVVAGSPVNVLMGLPGVSFSVSELAAAGVKRISLGSALARLSFATFIDAAREIADAGTFRFAGNAIGFAELEEHFPPDSPA